MLPNGRGEHGEEQQRNGKTTENGGERGQRQRGALIVLEGLDRSGKSTQARMLLEHLQNARGLPARIQRFPDRDEPTTGPAIDAFLRGAKSVDENAEAIHLIFAANRWLLSRQMRAELAAGTHLILDRYSHSGIAYSLAKGLDRRWVCQPELGLPRPDLVLFFDADALRLSARNGFGEEVMERSDFQQSVGTKMRALFNDKFWRRIDASRPINEVHKSVMDEVAALLDKMTDGVWPLEEFTVKDFMI